MGAFPVVRGKNDVGAVKTALQILKSDGVLGIFPEGTCVKNNDRGPVKPGAFNLALKTKATIIPFGIYTKNWRRHFFKPSRMSFGRPMTYDELFGDRAAQCQGIPSSSGRMASPPAAARSSHGAAYGL